MVSREFPSGAILVDVQPMTGREMPFEDLPAPAAFEANDIIAVNRAPDGDGGSPINFRFCRRSSKSRERPMDDRDQRRQLVGRDLISSNICGDDISREVATK